MRRALGTIHNDRNMVFMGYTNDFFHRIDCPEHIADMRDTDNLRLRRNHFLEDFNIHTTVVIHWNDLQYNAFSGRLKLPRHDIGMMFNGRNNDFITFLHEALTETGGYEVESFGCSTRENYLIRCLGIEKLAHSLAGSLMEFGGLLTEPMHSTVHIGIDVQIFFAHRIKHTKRLLRGSRIVKINEWTVINRSRKNWKIFSYLV